MKVMGAKKATRSFKVYPVEFKKEVVEVMERENLTAEEVGRMYGISDSSAYTWREAYRQLGEAGLVNQVPGVAAREGVPAELKEAIVQAKKEQPSAGVRRVKDFLARFKFLGVSKRTVETTLREEGLMPPPKRKKKKAKKEPGVRFERALPMDLWQSDIMTFHLKRFYPVYLIGFMDDCSRFMVGWGLYRQQTGQAVCDVLKGAIGEYGLPKEMLTDNGRQYASWRGKTRFQEILESHGIRHLRSRPHHPQTLGKIEAFWGHLWKEFLEKAVFDSFEDAVQRIGHWIKFYNFQRPHQGIGGIVPADRFYQMENKVKDAMKAGIAENEKLLAEQNPPQKPFFLTGRFGDKDLIIRQERDELVVDLPGGQTERIKIQPRDDGQAILPRQVREHRMLQKRIEEVRDERVKGGDVSAGPAEARPERPAEGESHSGGAGPQTARDGDRAGDGREPSGVLHDGPPSERTPVPGVPSEEKRPEEEGTRSGEGGDAASDRAALEGERPSGDPLAGGPAGDPLPGGGGLA